MSYAYYPGCSLHATAREYDESTRAVFENLGIGLREIEDWNCCGATALPSTSYLFSLVVPSRNLALAEEAGEDVAVACNSCFVTLRRAKSVYEENPLWRAKIQEAMGAIGRSFTARVQIRHVLDIVVNDVGLDRIAETVRRPLQGLKVVPYYGCQIARPKNEFAHPELPTEMDRLLEVLGAEVLRYDHKTKCCGGALMTTKPEAVLELEKELLGEAYLRGAEAMVVSCPLCQFNLDAYQDKVNKRFQTNYHIPVIYFTQLLGVAQGIAPKKLGLKRNLVPLRGLLHKYYGEVI
ncbi:Cysteine-rich domain protein [Acididesulfobacillus acetoxydans]|uniref:CoB--CoM heterodisulfide reductase subunit B n=1 Tax=Acididesulfobacillus acetoxydans TaxID=1561005 RepID=A0A8S0Y228_9FIRM|nr:CoB--CoM heterodisulfide reductase iron-sulfur subunit B family protein [Acididesulfobacillus acetoxydans]CAA7600255.1 Cysteine-rich domain protein [Acididesulfobacillus acetoxydans]CEJ09633.1 CoB--CoM heterodisulfide reductase subunit B [Acididesulfobacillus acetoxydans]